MKTRLEKALPGKPDYTGMGIGFMNNPDKMMRLNLKDFPPITGTAPVPGRVKNPFGFATTDAEMARTLPSAIANLYKKNPKIAKYAAEFNKKRGVEPYLEDSWEHLYGGLSTIGPAAAGMIGYGISKAFKDKKEKNSIDAISGASIPKKGKGGISMQDETVELRNNEGVLTERGRLVPTEQLGVTQPHPNTSQVNMPAGSAVISPKSIRQANKIARAQKPELDKINKVLNNPHSTSLARRTAERRLKDLKKAYDPILMAEAASRGNSADGSAIAAAGWLGPALKGALGLSNPVGAALSAAPMIYNLAQGIFGKVDKLNPESFQNPYESQIRSNMANRRFNADPLLEANRTASASAAYNIRNSGMGGGALASNMLGAQNARMRGDAQAYATKQQADNQYMQEQAVMDAQLGQQRANTNLEINQMNAQAKANKRNFLGTGLGQMGQFAQNNMQMANQQKRDKEMMAAYKEWMGLFKNQPGTPSKINGLGNIAPEFTVPGLAPMSRNYPVDPAYAWQMQGR